MPGYQGFGEQDPSSAASPFNATAFIVQAMLAGIATVKLVQVQAVDTNAKTVDVQPMVNQLDGQGNSTPHGTINAVPYVYAQAGDGAVIMDPAVGDKGVMVCCDRDISSAISSKAIANPGSFRQLDAADGVYLFGLPGLNTAPAQFIKFSPNGIEWHDRNGNEMLSNSAGISINGVVFNQQGQVAGNLPVNGTLQLSGSIKALNGSTYAGTIQTAGNVIAGFGTGDQIGLQTHAHISGNPGNQTSGPIAGT